MRCEWCGEEYWLLPAFTKADRNPDRCVECDGAATRYIAALNIANLAVDRDLSDRALRNHLDRLERLVAGAEEEVALAPESEVA